MRQRCRVIPTLICLLNDREVGGNLHFHQLLWSGDEYEPEHHGTIQDVTAGAKSSMPLQKSSRPLPLYLVLVGACHQRLWRGRIHDDHGPDDPNDDHPLRLAGGCHTWRNCYVERERDLSSG